MDDTAVDAFLTSSFGTLVTTLWYGVLSAPSWHTFTYLAYGWTLAYGRQTITTYLWGSGAAQINISRVIMPFEAGRCPIVVINAGHGSCAVAPHSCPLMPSLTSASMMPP